MIARVFTRKTSRFCREIGAYFGWSYPVSYFSGKNVLKFSDGDPSESDVPVAEPVKEKSKIILSREEISNLESAVHF